MAHAPTAAEEVALKAAYDRYVDLQQQIAALSSERTTHALKITEIDAATEVLNKQLGIATVACMASVKAWSGK